jgi:hypothetical protein
MAIILCGAGKKTYILSQHPLPEMFSELQQSARELMRLVSSRIMSGIAFRSTLNHGFHFLAASLIPFSSPRAQVCVCIYTIMRQRRRRERERERVGAKCTHTHLNFICIYPALNKSSSTDTLSG